jgi:hypothetical protein
MHQMEVRADLVVVAKVVLLAEQAGVVLVQLDKGTPVEILALV